MQTLGELGRHYLRLLCYPRWFGFCQTWLPLFDLDYASRSLLMSGKNSSRGPWDVESHLPAQRTKFFVSSRARDPIIHFSFPLTKESILKTTNTFLNIYPLYLSLYNRHTLLALCYPISLDFDILRSFLVIQKDRL